MTTTPELPPAVADLIRRGLAELEADAVAEREEKARQERMARQRKNWFLARAAEELSLPAGLLDYLDCDDVRPGDRDVTLTLPGCEPIHARVTLDSCDGVTLYKSWRAVPPGKTEAVECPTLARAVALARANHLAGPVPL